jgi:hypothetical protein
VAGERASRTRSARRLCMFAPGRRTVQ